MSEPLWLTEARKHIGQAEVPGPGANAWIKSLWLSLKGGAWFWSQYGQDDSKLPWCGAFAAAMMKSVGLVYPERYASALAWLEWGQGLLYPIMGCIVVFTRDGGGHVGFCTGVAPDGRLLILGGNQGNEVCIRAFPRERVSGYRWPAAVPVPDGGLLVGAAPATTGEA